MKILKKIFGYLALGVVVVVAVGAIYEWRQASADRERFPPPGQLVDAGDVELHIDCRGVGTPVIILEAGLGMDSTGWYKVHDALSETTRTCAYDRAGRGWSSLGDDPIASDLVVTRLHKMLSATIEDPMVLVGMSAGGIFVREYFRRYPDNIVGMVLIDSSHEEQADRLPEIPDAPDMTPILSLCTWGQPLGIIRAFSMLDAVMPPSDTPAEIRAVYRANAYQTHSCKALLLEISGFRTELQTPRRPPDLGDLPLLVLTQGKEPEAREAIGMTREQAVAQREVWTVLQQELAALSTRGKRMVATAAGHLIQIDQPEIVVDGIAKMITSLRETGKKPDLADHFAPVHSAAGQP